VNPTIEFRAALAEARAGMMRWMFGLFITQMLAIAGLFVALFIRTG
jgi:hypothetical protein